MREITTINAASGIRVVTSCTPKCFTSSDSGHTTISVKGDSGVISILSQPEDHLARTAASVINRIGDVVRASPGLKDNKQLQQLQPKSAKVACTSSYFHVI